MKTTFPVQILATNETARCAAPLRAVTLKEVAERAGVNKSCVSVVLNGAKSSAGVSAAARARILAVAEELSYQPHAVARALTQRRTNLLGFYSSYGHVDARNPFFADVIGGMQDGCEANAQQLVLYAQGRGLSPEDVFKALTNGTIDGLVLFSSFDWPLLERLGKARLPVVALADAVPGLPSVVVDDINGGRFLADHLAERGHRRVLYRKRPRISASSERRMDAFRERAHAHKLTVIECETTNDNTITDEEKALVCAPASTRPTAVACWSDFSAHQMLGDCTDLGLKVPHDLAIVGYDGFHLSMPSARQMTTIRAPWGLCAQTAIALLKQRVDGNEIAAETMLPIEFIQGDTT